MKIPILICLALLGIGMQAQEKDLSIPEVDELPLSAQPAGTLARYWLKVGSDAQGRSVVVPVLLVKGVDPGPVLGVTAAVHGNEVNGIRAAQELCERTDPKSLRGVVVAIPGLNPQAITRLVREYPDGEDLNRVFPGKAGGNESQVMAHAISQKLLPHLDYLADLHTASFGRENSLYVRADLQQDTLLALATGFGADVVLDSREASAGSRTGGTLREAAATQGIPGFTVELGNPQVYQPELIDRGVAGLLQAMDVLGMRSGTSESFPAPVVCSRSFWVYTDQGGMLDSVPALLEQITQGQLIGVLRNAFGQEITRYYAPASGVVIGRASNPVVRSGGRILHLGIIAKMAEE
ncbi:succinylglutamate desuccinylase/aspartoacylase family protein [Robiginitalea sp. M366]|uniref:succinylglutamate desuccinylase/aspartoacylase family protein n=1 Tax=Robiginitalea aestuariiviva TaxID=3036903 RepID=UPI00240DB9CA|nr:succinylglutamate desuccinylase/aspartoacylase family protein [Robiginitalea aestuariiviva]MDG1571586.1 succinylglutamate desuccinylase/aspartoacylase family protein [Robiginitalea aestuariiviva]